MSLVELGGEIWYVDMHIVDRILALDTSGRIRREIGRPGAGPGEFSYITALAK